VDISCQFGTSILFENLTMTIPSGGVQFITGKSGSGKSTLLETIAGIIPVQKGSLFWDGHDIHNSGRVVMTNLEFRSAVVFQQHALISYLPLFENIALPLRHHKRGTKSEIDEIVHSLVQRLQLDRVAWNLPETLSEGQRKLGAIARALSINPEFLCMDEPMHGLDIEQRQLLFKLFDELVIQKDKTIVIATDDQELLSRCDFPIHDQNSKVYK